MIYSSIHSDFAAETYPEVIKKALKLIKETDFGQYEDGKYFPVEGSDQFFMVSHLTTKQIADAKPEAHKNYLDIQFLLKGKERIGVVIDDGKQRVLEDKLDEKDVIFFKDVQNETFITMNEGDFCILFPSDIHRPGCEKDGLSEIIKVVYKINVKLL